MEKLNKIFKDVSLIGIHLTLRDELEKHIEEISSEKFEEAQKTVLEVLELYKPFMPVLDKQRLLIEVGNMYKDIFKEKELNDSTLISIIEPELVDLDEEDKKIFFDAILLIALKNDDKISVKEKQLLAFFYNNMNISKKSFSDYIESFIKSYKKLLISESSESIENDSKRPLFLICAAGVSFLILIGVIIWFNYFPKHTTTKIHNPSSIVFKKVLFERYIVAGNFDTAKSNNFFGKLVVFFISGEADIQFDTKNITLKKVDNNSWKDIHNRFGILFGKTNDDLNNNWIAVYKNPKPKKFQLKNVLPFIVDVNISQKDYYQVINVQPEKINESLASKAGKIVGTVVGIGGAYIGARCGASIGSAIGKIPIVSGGIGALIGGAAGGAAAGYTGYVITKKFLTGLQLSPSINQADKDKILEKAKALIAAEYLLNEEQATWLKDSFNNYIKEFYKNFGINIIKITYQ